MTWFFGSFGGMFGDDERIKSSMLPQNYANASRYDYYGNPKDSGHLNPSSPTTVIPQARFRLKGDILQQAVTGTGGGRVFWQDVPRVAPDAPDFD
jgi:hypothetical protein